MTKKVLTELDHYFFFNRNFVVIPKFLTKTKSLKCIYENIPNMDLYTLYTSFSDADIEPIFDRVSQ